MNPQDADWFPGNKGAKITYQDDGVGMTEEVLAKIYDPFFTTKRGKGSIGLGMNIVYNLINQKLKGKLKITSVINVGSTFVLTLPKSIEG